MRVMVLGAGRVGSAIVRDLASDPAFEVAVADASDAALEQLGGTLPVEVRRADLSRPGEVAALVEGAGVVVGALPGFMGYRSVQACIEAGRDIVDISFFPEDAYGLDEAARRAGVRCLVDFGIAPGVTNLVFGRARTEFARLDGYACYVGGLPVERRLPWEYQAPFSPVDVLEEYTRPARYVSGGRVVTEPPLGHSELLDFRGVGTLEGFLTDGLRTLLRYADEVGFMIEKTLRYPGYRDRIALLRDCGFLDANPVELDGVAVKPLDLAARLLLGAWEQRRGDEDLTALRIVSTGEDRSGRLTRETWELLDRYDPDTGTTSMARTTGYTCTAGVRLLAQGLWTGTGVTPPEVVGADGGCFDFVMDELRKRGVVFRVVRE